MNYTEEDEEKIIKEKTKEHNSSITKATSREEFVRKCLNTENMSENEIQRCLFWITAHDTVKRTQKHNFQEAKILVNKSWNLELLESWLSDYKDKEVINYLKYGWPLNQHETDVNTRSQRIRKEHNRTKKR